MNAICWVAASLIYALVISGMGWRLLSVGTHLKNAKLWMSGLFLVQTVTLCVESALTGQCPVLGTAGALFFLSWALNVFYLVLGHSYRVSLLGIFTAPAIAALTLSSLLVSGDDFSVNGGVWLTTHVALIMMAYGAGALSAIAGVAFCLQDSRLKKHRIPGTDRPLPPIRRLETCMKRLVLVITTLLVAGLCASALGHLSASLAKIVLVVMLLVGYGVLLVRLLRFGIPGRTLSYWCIGLFVLSLSIFLVR